MLPFVKGERMLDEKQIKEIQEKVLAHARKHGIALLPGTYKKLFVKFAKQNGFTEEDCLNADRELAFEKLNSKAAKLKDEKMKEIHIKIEETKEKLVVHLEEDKRKLDESVDSIRRSITLDEKRELKKKMDAFLDKYTQLFNKLNEVKENIENIEETLKDVDEISIQDPVTLLGNCRYFEMAFNGELYTLKRYKTPVCLLLIRLTNIVQISQRFGHSVEHAVVRSIANIIYENCRSSDTVTRCEGGDFRILLHNTDKEKAELFAEKIRYLLNRIVFQKNNERFKVKVSYGLTQLRDSDTIEKALMRIMLKQ